MPQSFAVCSFYTLAVFVGLNSASSALESSAPTSFSPTAASYTVPSGAIYVAPHGADTAAGTAAAPLSLSQAVKKATSGSTIVLKGGTYSLTAPISLSKTLTLENAPGETVWIRGDISVAGGWSTEVLSNGKTVWRRDGWNYSFPNTLTGSYLDAADPYAGLRDMMTRGGVPLAQVGAKTQLVSGTFFVDTANQRLYVADAPTSDMTATAALRAFSIWQGVDSTGYAYSGKNCLLRGLNFRGFAEDAVMIGSPNVTVDNCLFAWSGSQGVSVADNGRVNTGVVLRNSRFASNGRKGIAANKVDGLTVENCIIDNNNAEGFNVGHDAAGAKFVGCRNVTIRDCQVTDNYANGLWFDVSCINPTAYRNRIENNVNGLYCEISTGGKLLFNVLVGNAWGITVSGASNTRVYNNTLVENGIDIEVKDDGRINDPTVDTPLQQGAGLDGNPLEPGESAEDAALGATWMCRSNTFRNNLFFDAGGEVLYKADWTARGEATSAMISASDHNAFGRPSTGPGVIKWNQGSKTYRLYTALSAFLTANPTYENSSQAADGTDPYFVSASTGDYRLRSTSPAVKAGAALPADLAQLLGVPASPQNIGALEAVAGAPASSWSNSAIADAYVRDGSYASQNFGTVSELRQKTDSTTGQGYNRTTLLRFDLSNVGSVTSAKLRLWGNSVSGASLPQRVRAVSNTTWSETGVTWSNLPALGSELSRTTLSGTAEKYYEWDITTYVQQAVAKGQTLLSLAVDGPAANVEQARFYSREAASNKPQIIFGGTQKATAAASTASYNVF